MEGKLSSYETLNNRRGLSSSDWKTVQSKVCRANIEQLYFLKQVIDQELVKRNNQVY